MIGNSAKSLYICTVLVASLVSITSGLSLEELSLEIQQLRQNVQHLEGKVQHLETKLMEQEKKSQAPHNVHPVLQGNANLLGKQADQRNAIFRTCRELSQADPSLESGMYWIDPDGQGVGDDPIYVECDMATGTTSIPHDSEDPIDVGHCADPGCYSRQINYSATMQQMDALSELSSECHQSIRYDCYYAPFEFGGAAQAWWNDRNGAAQYFWSGSDNSVHTCQCGIDHNCIEPLNVCNCDSAAPVPLNDSGVITEKSYLPVTRLNFGRTQLEASSGVHTLGRFECSGQVSVSGMPTSCSDLWKIGYSLSGIYSVMGSKYVDTVYCDFARLPHEQGFQRRIGYSDVKSSLVYFYAQKHVSHSAVGRIPFEHLRTNIGSAMSTSGIFTAPRSGIYSFAFSGLSHHLASSSVSVIRMDLVLNGNRIGRAQSDTHDDESYLTYSLDSILELKAGDQVWLIIDSLAYAQLFDNGQYYTHFTGILLQENVASSLN